MRRITRTILFIALTAWGWLEPSHAAAQTKIRLATLLPRGSSHYQILESMGQQWREASGGSINLTIYADGTMGGEAETVQRMRVGQIQDRKSTRLNSSHTVISYAVFCLKKKQPIS